MSDFTNNYNNDEALDWNDTVEEQVFENLPNGDYNFQIVGFERARFPGSEKMSPCPQAIITVRVDGGAQYGNREMKTMLFLNKKTQGRLFAFFEAIGAPRTPDGKVTMDWNRVNGARGRCTVGEREYNGKKYNEIKKFLPPAPPAPQQTWQNGGF